MWKSLLIGLASVPLAALTLAGVWISYDFRTGAIASLAVLGAFWLAALIVLLANRRISTTDVFLPIPIAIVWSAVMTMFSFGLDAFTAPACIGSAIVLSMCLWLIHRGRCSITWAILPAIVFIYEMLPINIPGPFDDWFAFGGDVTYFLLQNTLATLRPAQVEDQRPIIDLPSTHSESRSLTRL